MEQKPESNNVPDPIDQLAQAEPKPPMHPALAVILTMILVVVGLVAGFVAGGMTGVPILTVVFAVLSVFVTANISAGFFRPRGPVQPGIKDKSLAKAASIGFVIVGVLVGFFVGAIVAFGACFKSDCSPAEAGAPLFLPMTSLLFTLPPTIRAFKKPEQNGQASDKPPSANEPPTHTDARTPAPSESSIAVAQPKMSSNKWPWIWAAIGVGAIVLFFVIPTVFGGPEPKTPRGAYFDLRFSDEKQAVVQKVDASLDQVASASSALQFYEESSEDFCESESIGDKWSGRKRVECTYVKTHFFGYGGNRKEVMVGLEDILQKSGWESGYGRTRPISSYFGRLDAQRLDSSDPDPERTIPSLNERYQKDDVLLDVADSLRSQPLNYFVDANQKKYYRSFESEGVSALVNVQLVANDVFQTHPYMLSVTSSTKYYVGPTR